MDAGVAGLIGAAIGAVAGVGGAVVSTLIASRSEERRHFRSLGVQIGAAKFEEQKALAKHVANMKGGIVYTQPYEGFLVYGIRLMDIVTDTSLSADEIKTRIDALGKSVARDLPKQ